MWLTFLISLWLAFAADSVCELGQDIYSLYPGEAWYHWATELRPEARRVYRIRPLDPARHTVWVYHDRASGETVIFQFNVNLRYEGSGAVHGDCIRWLRHD
jgi:hypothetical protein